MPRSGDRGITRLNASVLGVLSGEDTWRPVRAAVSLGRGRSGRSADRTTVGAEARATGVRDGRGTRSLSVVTVRGGRGVDHLPSLTKGRRPLCSSGASRSHLRDHLVSVQGTPCTPRKKCPGATGTACTDNYIPAGQTVRVGLTRSPCGWHHAGVVLFLPGVGMCRWEAWDGRGRPKELPARWSAIRAGSYCRSVIFASAGRTGTG